MDQENVADRHGGSCIWNKILAPEKNEDGSHILEIFRNWIITCSRRLRRRESRRLTSSPSGISLRTDKMPFEDIWKHN